MVTTSAPPTDRASRAGGSARCSKSRVDTANPIVPARTQRGQPQPGTSAPSAREHAACDTVPARMPPAVAAANVDPCWSARTRAIGPDVKGRPTA